MLRKYAVADILDAKTARNAPDGSIVKGAHRVTFDYQPREGYIYVRSRMISSRVNDNFDGFPAEEIEKGYRTFLGKPVFVNHHNEDHRKARGIILDAALHRDLNPDGSKDWWAEGLMEVDAMTYPKLAKAILAGHIDRTSMGVDVEKSICSACGNTATTPLEYCAHVPGMKGKKIWRTTASGHKTGKLIYESCFGLSFFENSLLVEEPADPTAFFLGSVTAGPGLDHLTAGMNRTASRHTAETKMLSPDTPANNRASAPGTPDDQIEDKDIAPSSRFKDLSLGEDEKGIYVKNNEGRSPSYDSPQDIPVTQLNDMRSASLRLVAGTRCPMCFGLNTTATMRGEQDCWDCGHGFYVEQSPKMAAGPKYPHAADHPFFQEHPVHHDNITSHWHDASDDEKEQGKSWYKDAHTIAKGIGSVTGHDTHTAAGIVANYSPQQGWAGNLHNAAKVMREGHGIGGKGSGMFASDQQRKSADRILSGEHHDDVLKGHKVKDFAHLIEHGGDANPHEPRAVVDRHALGVAAGKRMSDDDYGKFPKTQRHYYNHVVGAYHQAAKHLSEHEGEPIYAHQVQAVTWLVRQRKNQEAEQASHGADSNADRLNKGREVGRQRSEQGWHDYRNQHFPGLGEGPGTGYEKNEPKSARRRLAYGETKAPGEIDTLREESCPVCGEENAWDGDKCDVCGFIPPPKAFQDPDLDKAKQLDLRQDKEDGINRDPDPTSETAPDNDVQFDEDKAAQEESENYLVCNACGEQFPAGGPRSTDTDAPELGNRGEGQVAEGDVCPACGQGVLESAPALEANPDAIPAEEGGEQMPGEEEEAPAEEEFGAEEEEQEEDPESEDEDEENQPAKKAPFPPKR